MVFLERKYLRSSIRQSSELQTQRLAVRFGPGMPSFLLGIRQVGKASDFDSDIRGSSPSRDAKLSWADSDKDSTLRLHRRSRGLNPRRSTMLS